MAVNWKHAVGEVCLIVVGILLALAVNNWSTGRQNRANRSGGSQAETATPVSYEAVLRDQMFRNILDYRLPSLEVNVIQPAALATKEVSELLVDLRAEVGEDR